MQDFTFVLTVIAKTSAKKPRVGIVYYDGMRTDFRQFEYELKSYILDRITDTGETIYEYESWLNESAPIKSLPDYMERLSDFDVEWLQRYF